MKRKFSFLLSLLIPVMLPAQNTVSVHCTFSSNQSDSCSVTPAVYFIAEYEKSYAVKIQNNSADFSFPIEKSTLAEFSYAHQTVQLFLEPGDALQLNIGADSLNKSVTFSGKGAEANSFLQKFNHSFASDFNKSAIATDILANDVDAFEMKLFDERKKQLAFFNGDAAQASFSEAFKKFMSNTIRYHYFATLLSYPIIRANQSKDIMTVSAFPAAMMDGIDAKLVNDEALITPAYRDFLFYYDVYFTSASNNFQKFTDLSSSMERKVITAQKNFSGASLTWFIASFLNDNVSKVSQYTAKHIYDVLVNNDASGNYSALLKKKVDARLAMKDAVVASGNESNPAAASNENQAPGSMPKLKDMDGNYFTFDDLKGKVVYVDYWASWCGPCRMQMPYSKQLHERFTEQQLKQIVFLYISIDADESQWKAAVQQIGMQGKLGISPGNWQSPITQYFQINSIPRYMLIDKKGNIVNLNAPRPSSGDEIYNDILQLL